MIGSFFSALVLAVVQLTGVTGESLRARAFFDANNVKVGDPLVLTLDFIGDADFASLHPPTLSRQVKSADWRVDDTSAKTDTFSGGRRLVYRVRPLHDGVLWFPAMEFEYVTPGGEKKIVRSNDIPVHAVPGAKVEIAELESEAAVEMPKPDDLIVEVQGLSDDESFAWRKACANPSADSFAAFDFPEAKLNEARCAVLAGDWERAMRVYTRLEWKIGQTPAIERGMLAAIAVRFNNPQVELPVWRQVARPLLRYPLWWRIGIVLGAIALLSLLFALLSRAIRALAVIAVVLLSTLAWAGPGDVDEMFREMEARHQQMMQQMQQMQQSFFSSSGGSGFNISIGGVQQQQAPELKASLSFSKPSITVGEPFELIFSLEAPRNCTLDQLSFSPENAFGLQIDSNGSRLTDVAAKNPTNVIHRYSFPARYNVPYRGNLAFFISGMASTRSQRGSNRNAFNFSFSTSFRVKTAPFAVAVTPLPDQPPDFSGIVADNLLVQELPDMLTVATNDVICISYISKCDGYIPDDYQPDGVAYEWARAGDKIEWRAYFVADGKPVTPRLEIVYYQPKTKSFKRVSVGGSRVKYR